MIFIPRSVSITTGRGFIMMEFDLIDDNNNVSIENIVVSSIESYGLPKFIFYKENDGEAYLYGKSRHYKEGQEITTHINIPGSLLSESIIRKLEEERSAYLKSKLP